MYKTTFKGQDIEEDKIDFESLDYKNIKVLNNFINDQGKIMPRRMTGLTSKQQKKIASLIKKSKNCITLTFRNWKQLIVIF